MSKGRGSFSRISECFEGKADHEFKEISITEKCWFDQKSILPQHGHADNTLLN